MLTKAQNFKALSEYMNFIGICSWIKRHKNQKGLKTAIEWLILYIRLNMLLYILTTSIAVAVTKYVWENFVIFKLEVPPELIKKRTEKILSLHDEII